MSWYDIIWRFCCFFTIELWLWLQTRRSCCHLMVNYNAIFLDNEVTFAYQDSRLYCFAYPIFWHSSYFVIFWCVNRVKFYYTLLLLLHFQITLRVASCTIKLILFPRNIDAYCYKIQMTKIKQMGNKIESVQIN